MSGRIFRMTFVEPDGKEREVDAPEGATVLEIAHHNDIDLEGACESSMSCSTCHVIVDPRWHGRLPASTEEEDDILDFAFGPARTSRLGCQITITKELDGLVVRLPAGARNMLLG